MRVKVKVSVYVSDPVRDGLHAGFLNAVCRSAGGHLRRGPGMLEHKSTGDPDPNGATHQVTVHASLKKQGSIWKVRGIPE